MQFCEDTDGKVVMVDHDKIQHRMIHLPPGGGAPGFHAWVYRVLIFILFGAGSTPIEATVHRIPAGVNVLSLALQTVSAGDTLLLVTSAGRYHEPRRLVFPAFPLFMMADSTLSEKPVITVDNDKMVVISHDFSVKGIHFDGRDQTEYAIHSNAANPNRIIIENCVFSGFTKDAITDDDQPVAHCEVRHSVFYDIGATAIEFRTKDMCASLLVEACTFYRLGEHAVHITQVNQPAVVRILQVTIYDVIGGIYFNGIGDGAVHNSIIAQSRVYGIRSTLPAVVSDICMYNNRADYSLFEKGPGCFRAEPKFYNPEIGDFSLLPDSPCLELEGKSLGDPRWVGAATVRAGQLYKLNWASWIVGTMVLLTGIGYGAFWGLRRYVRNKETLKSAVLLQASEAKYRDLFDAAHDVILIVNARGDILDINRRGEELTGYPHDRLIAKNLLLDLVFSEDQSHIQKIFAGITTGESGLCQVRWRRYDRSLIYLEGSLTPRLTPAGVFEGARGMFRDISERQKVEFELMHIERLRSIGELAAGMSHNLNNLLAGVLLPADIARQKTTDKNILRYLDAIEISGKRAADLVQRLYTSVRGHSEILEAVDVNRIIQDVVQTTRPRWENEAESHGISIAINLDLTDIPKARCSPAGLHDVLTNLMLNAIDAMPRGGTLTLSSCLIGDQIRIAVQDTGIGMDETTRSRVFEPFFTTKADAGTGLGLATVYNTVTGWKGDVGVISQLDEGTTFFVDLQKWVEPEKIDAVVGVMFPTECLRILVVDNEEMIQKILSEILGEKHEVKVCKDGNEALYLAQKEHFDVALIDLVLPEMRGDEIAQALRLYDSNMTIVMISGWHLDLEDTRLAHVDFYLKKPFTNRAILDTLAKAVILRTHRLNGLRVE